MTQTWSMQSDPIFECIDALIKSDKLEVSPSLTEYNRQENLASGSRYVDTFFWEKFELKGMTSWILLQL